MTAKISILFFSKSVEAFDAISDNCFSKWSFHLVSPDVENPQFDRLNNSDVLIVDTYTLGIKFLKQLRSDERFVSTPIIVLDSYHRGIFVDDIVRNWAKGYLSIDRFSEDLEEAIEAVIGGDEYRSGFLQNINN